MNKKVLILLISSVLFLMFIVYDLYVYNVNNYDVVGFVFVCNSNICEVRHKKSNGQIKYIDKIDINNIEKFSYRLERIPRLGGEGQVIYVERKDGTSFRFSPVYIRPSKYLEEEFITPINCQLKMKPVNIYKSFPR